MVFVGGIDLVLLVWIAVRLVVVWILRRLARRRIFDHDFAHDEDVRSRVARAGHPAELHSAAGALRAWPSARLLPLVRAHRASHEFHYREKIKTVSLRKSAFALLKPFMARKSTRARISDRKSVFSLLRAFIARNTFDFLRTVAPTTEEVGVKGKEIFKIALVAIISIVVFKAIATKVPAFAPIANKL